MGLWTVYMCIFQAAKRGHFVCPQIKQNLLLNGDISGRPAGKKQKPSLGVPALFLGSQSVFASCPSLNGLCPVDFITVFQYLMGLTRNLERGF